MKTVEEIHENAEVWSLFAVLACVMWIMVGVMLNCFPMMLIATIAIVPAKLVVYDIFFHETMDEYYEMDEEYTDDEEEDY